MKKESSKSLIVILILLCAACTSNAEVRVRPAEWATPVIGSSMDNLYLVDQGVYRSEQPEKRGFSELSNLGLKEVLNLREYHSDDDEAEKTTLRLHRIKINTGDISEQQVIAALKIIKDRKGPIVVHCWHGSDRTGTVIASYRVIFNNWSKEKAIDELRNGGYGYHARIYPNIVTLINNLNVTKIKTELGIN